MLEEGKRLRFHGDIGFLIGSQNGTFIIVTVTMVWEIHELMVTRTAMVGVSCRVARQTKFTYGLMMHMNLDN